jgi:hypothetical protein
MCPNAEGQGMVLVWGLGPRQCYERLNQTGGVCDPGPWSPHLGEGEAPYLTNQRMLDPHVSNGRTNAPAHALATGTAVFNTAWAAAVKARASGVWDPPTAWDALHAAMPLALRLSPVAANRCSGGDDGGGGGSAGGGDGGNGDGSGIVGQTANGACLMIL